MTARAARHLSLFAAAVAAFAAMPSSASAETYGSRTLSVGTRGSDVKQLQRYLSLAGHRIVRDGEFGSRTARALRSTERNLELNADGIATRRDQRAIRRAVRRPDNGGSAYALPPPPAETVVVPGATGQVGADGFAVAPESAPPLVKSVIAAGNAIAHTPYKWGGGHGSWTDTGYDCSGSVSYALYGGGLLTSSLVSGAFAGWGERGPGQWITIYANASHVYMVVAGLRFDTSARSQTGSRWTTTMRSSAGFAVTHPAGL
jgi:cell wall-associated NlpC family hydrolase